MEGYESTDLLQPPWQNTEKDHQTKPRKQVIEETDNYKRNI